MSETNGATCPKCQSPNPKGAKFCSTCRESLAGGSSPEMRSAPAPAVPPPRPSLAGMIGQTGGKTESTAVDADPAAVFSHVVRYIQGLEGSEIRQQNAPLMLVARIAYRDLLATGGMPVKVDATIAVAASAPGQSTVTMTSKLDFASTNTIWMIFGGLLLFLIATNMLLIMQYLMLGALAAAISYWMLSTRPPAKVTEALFDDLRANAGRLQDAAADGPSHASPSTSSAHGPKPPPPAGSAHTGNGTARDDDEVFARIRKLAELRDAGAIGAEDFEAKKAELLSRL